MVSCWCSDSSCTQHMPFNVNMNEFPVTAKAEAER